MSLMKSLRAFAQGSIDENVLRGDLDEDVGVDELENDDEFMADVLEECVGVIVSMEILGEAAATLDEATQEAYQKVCEYLAGQGLISEAASMSVRNPKVTFVRLSPKAQIARLASIITLKIARKKDSIFFKKYKIGQRIKRENMEKMVKQYGNQAKKLALQLYKSLKKRGKVPAVVDDAQKKTGLKKKSA